MSTIEPTPATRAVADRELAALGVRKVNLKLWVITVTGTPSHPTPLHFYLDDGAQGIDTREAAIEYAEEILGDNLWDSITAFPTEYTITND